MKLRYLIIFVLLEFGMLFIGKNIKIEDRKKLLVDSTNKIKKIYVDTNLHFDQISYLVFNGYVNQKEVLKLFKNRNRKKLFDILNDKYAYIRNVNFELLHFHLPNNDSFLRFHKPKKHGDSLTKKRYSVDYVNKHKKPVKGLEMGKIIPGFRYVYPLFYNNKHIGSVENSLSMVAFISDLKNILPVDVNFIIKKDIVDKKIFKYKKNTYIQSTESQDYYKLDIKQIEIEHTKKDTFSEKHKQILQDGINKKKSFSIIFKNNTITFLLQKNIQNEHIGYFVIYENNNNIKKIEEHFMKKSIIFTLIIILVLFLIYKNNLQKSLLVKKVLLKTNELEKLNKSLKIKIDNALKKALLKEKELHEASRMVQMGEMIGNIAHQWRQPLSIITSIASNVRIQLEIGNIVKNKIDDDMVKINETAQYLSKIIDTFRNFLNEKKELKEQLIEDNIDSALDIVAVVLKDVNISLINTVDYENKTKLNIVSGELPEVIINIINNAKDILLEQNIKVKWVKINSFKDDEKITITIEDNAGGIDDDIINKVFEPYFTTKHKKIGTGLGLHMSKRIINESLNGNIYVKNTTNGAIFYIEIPIT